MITPEEIILGRKQKPQHILTSDFAKKFGALEGHLQFLRDYEAEAMTRELWEIYSLIKKR